MSGRFDYVKYDDVAQEQQATFKKMVEIVEQMIDVLPHGRHKSLALTSLEECYMWIGKSLRDDQISRNGCAPILEERKDG